MLKLRVYAKMMEKKDGKGKFLTFNVVGKKCNVKFTQDAQADLEVKLPKENGYYLITIDNTNKDVVSLAHPKKDAQYQYDTLWIRDGSAVKSIEKDVEYEAKKALERANAIANFEADDLSKDDAENIFDR